MSNINSSLKDLCSILIQLQPLNNESEGGTKILRDILKTCTKDLYLSQQDQGMMEQKCISAFSTKDWKAKVGILRFSDFSMYKPTEWPEFKTWERPGANIGVFDSTKSSVECFKEIFYNYKAQNRGFLWRVIIIAENIQQFKDEIKIGAEEPVIYIKNIHQIQAQSQQIEELKNYLFEQMRELTIQIMLNLQIEVDKIKTDQNPTYGLFNKKEEKISDQGKLKKRKFGRVSKILGDLCLQALCPYDALMHYRTAMESLKKCEDDLWYSGYQEGLACISYLRYSQSHVNSPEDLEEGQLKVIENDIVKNMQGSISSLKKTKLFYFELESHFRFLNTLSELRLKLIFNENVRNFLTQANFTNVEEQCRLYCKISGLYKGIEMHRKSANYLRIAGILISQSNKNLAQKLLCLTSSCYQLHAFNPYAKGQQKSTQFWPNVQISFMYDLVSTFQDDQVQKNKILRHMLQVFSTHLEAKQSQNIFHALTQVSPFISHIENTNLTFFPLVIRMSISGRGPIIKQRQDLQNLQEGQVFIFEPWKKNKTERLVFSKGDSINFKIFMSNIFPFEVFLDVVTIVGENVEILNYPNSIELPAKCPNLLIEQKIKPLEQGTLCIKGIKVRIFNTIYEHQIDTQGFGIDFIEKYGKPEITTEKVYDLSQIDILPQMPNLQFHLTTHDEQEEEKQFLSFESTESPIFRLTIENKGDMIIDFLKIDGTLEFETIQYFNQIYNMNLRIEAYQKVILLMIPNSMDKPQLQQEHILTRSKSESKLMNQNQVIEMLLPPMKEDLKNLRRLQLEIAYSNINLKHQKEIVIQKEIQINNYLCLQRIGVMEQGARVQPDSDYYFRDTNEWFKMEVSLRKEKSERKYRIQVVFDGKVIHETDDLVYKQELDLLFTLERINPQRINEMEVILEAEKVQIIAKLKEQEMFEKVVEVENSEVKNPFLEFLKRIFCIKWVDIDKKTQGQIKLVDGQINDVQSLTKMLLSPVQLKLKYKKQYYQKREIVYQEESGKFSLKKEEEYLELEFEFFLEPDSIHDIQIILMSQNGEQIECFTKKNNYNSGQAGAVSKKMQLPGVQFEGLNVFQIQSENLELNKVIKNLKVHFFEVKNEYYVQVRITDHYKKSVYTHTEDKLIYIN